MLSSFNPPFNMPFIFNILPILFHPSSISITMCLRSLPPFFISLLENSKINPRLCIISSVNTSMHLSYKKAFFSFYKT